MTDVQQPEPVNKRSMHSSRKPVPHPTLKRRSSNPFSDNGERNNFPGLDAAFETTPKALNSSKRASQNSSSSLSDREPYSGYVLDESTCSSSFASSSLDMSIGARAAFTEHVRHICKYGLDGVAAAAEQHNSSRDEEWERLMDGNTSVASWCSSSAAAAAASSSSNNTSLPGTGITYMAPVYCQHEDGNDSVEIVTDLNISDYFNSSRVQYLATPEKNKHSEPNSVTLRSTEHHPLFPSSFDEEEKVLSSSECNSSSYSQDSALFKAAMGLSEQAQVLQDSFSADVSHISASSDDEEETCTLPDTLFQHASEKREASESRTDIRTLIPPIEVSPSKQFRDDQDISTASTPLRGSPSRRYDTTQAPRESSFENFVANFSEANTPKRGSPRRSMLSLSQPQNASFEHNTSLPNFSSLALSPIDGRSDTGSSSLQQPFCVESASPIKKCQSTPHRSILSPPKKASMEGRSDTGNNSSSVQPFCVEESVSPIKKCRTPHRSLFSPPKKKKTAPPPTTTSFDFLSLALSPIAARAGSEAGRILRDSTNNTSSVVSSPSGSRAPRSPPSRLSRHHGDMTSFFNAGASSLFTFTEEEPVTRIVSTTRDSSTDKPNNNENSSMRATTGAATSMDSLNLSRPSIDSSLLLTKPSKDDIHNYRRQFRSVVPRRVYSMDHTDELLLARDDSFSTPAAADTTSSCSTTQEEELNGETKSRSLLESFESVLFK